MTNMDDYRNADGKIDWSAYQKAEISSGERCYKCEGYIGLFSNGMPRLCYECKSIDKKEELDHSKFLRCPKCCKVFETDEMYEIFESGEHEVNCPKCEFEFEIETRVTFSFISPELIGETKQ